eukprot:TRINITY_DN88252_c0_g1_i1.p1 TRINITY_DN88252_c0_g1~~TRINITY_DN88252_c0_g1_i1.p1  ORF type:complete len:374 (+),score=71.01 TRINITY_DN88252_c0_g1_i1:248-1369(+)
MAEAASCTATDASGKTGATTSSASPETLDSTVAGMTGEATSSAFAEALNCTFAEDVMQCSAGSLASQKPTVSCSPDMGLGDACGLLLNAARTACVVVDSNGFVLGVLTENDVLQAFLEGADFKCSVRQWLRGGGARLPGFLVSTLTLKPSSTLMDAAAKMSVQVEGDFARHHLLVTGPGADHVRLLSALDVARGMLKDSCTQASIAAGFSVAAAMKPRASVPICLLSDSLADAFDLLCSSRQNSVLVVPSSSEEDYDPALEGAARVGGLITPADALRAFSLQVSGKNLSLASWLRMRSTSPEERLVSSEASLASAVDVMCNAGVHHLLVEAPGRSKITGILSALDVVRVLGSLRLTSPGLSNCSWRLLTEATE